MTGITKRQSKLRLAALAGVIGAVTVACSAEGDRPQQAMINNEDSVAVHRLINLSDPYGDVFIAPERGIFIDFGRTESIIECNRADYFCTEWPFVFSFPHNGEAPVGSWTAGEYTFEVVAQAERDFCGRSRDVYLIQGSNSVGWATRVWYHPSFGVYAVMSGQAEEGRMVSVERAFTTCDRGLYSRSYARSLRAREDDDPFNR